MKNTFRTVTKIWAELYNVSTGETWAAKYTDENDVEHTLIPADTVRYYFYYKYGDFYCEYMVEWCDYWDQFVWNWSVLCPDFCPNA